MARQTKARLDTKGLTGLGLEKLIEILLEELVSNKALKARLTAALASKSGPEEVARLIDKRLNTLEGSKSRVSASKARELAVELLGLARNIASELGTADALAAMERLVRLLSIYDSIDRRLSENSVKLEKSFSEAASMAVDLAPKLNEVQQLHVVSLLEATRKKDRYGRMTDIFGDLLCALQPTAADRWKPMIAADAAASKTGSDRVFSAIAILQKFADHGNDLDGFVTMEELKPATHRDNLGIARRLHVAGRHQEALRWLLDTPKGARVVSINGFMGTVSGDYQSRERKLLEAEIRDGLKEREKAQEIRWNEFLASFDAKILRSYIAKLPDFAEFDELDKAFAAVRAGENVYAALNFLIEWPKLEVASEHVVRNKEKWNGIKFDWLVTAADTLAPDYPVAATILYRSMLDAILSHGRSDSYVDAASFWAVLVEIAPRLPETVPFEKHSTYLARLEQKYARKYVFWNVLPSELRV